MRVGTVKPGKRRKKGFAATISAPATGQFVVAVANATNAVAERDEGNNAAPFGPLQ